jgi:importin subunit beta-1
MQCCRQHCRAATQAAYHALFFAGPNFEDQKQRDAIMASILKCAEDSDQKVREYAYSCLNLTAKQYYHSMSSYMERIFHTTIASVKNETDPTVAANAVEFWISIAEVCCPAYVLMYH